MDNERRSYNIGAWIGIVAFPFFIPVDWILYPYVGWELTILRLFTSFYFIIVRLIVLRINERNLLLLGVISIFIAAISVSLSCYIPEEGLKSPYFTGLFIVMIVASILHKLDTKYFAILSFLIIMQHFCLLLFLPWSLKNITTQLSTLGFAAIACLSVHSHLMSLLHKIKTLKGYLPICSECKKIRDDKGYWNQIEKYISDHSEVFFSHSMCEECAMKLYGYKKNGTGSHFNY